MEKFEVVLEDDLDHEVLDILIRKNKSEDFWIKGYDYAEYEHALERGKWLARFLEVEFEEL